jgi:hemerythrin-like domain-containing protein
MADLKRGESLERRKFLGRIGRTALMVVGGYAIAIDTARAADDDADEDIGPLEDLMREHGVLRRVLLIYEEGLRRISARQDFPGNPFLTGAQLIRKFIEDYHEKNEEKFIFPKLQNAFGEARRDVPILLEQHQVGRKLTDEIIRVAPLNAKDNRLIEPVTQFIRMYRPHAAREDTIVFPALRAALSEKQFDEIGEQMEHQEHKLFGEDGFAKIVEAVAEEERALGIYELDSFTPRPSKDD